jgi:predicted DNA-binding transcriptional regulator AlpA
MPKECSKDKSRSPKIAVRGLSRTEAAAYIGVSPSLFDAMVKDGRIPRPVRVNSRRIWDMWELDAAFDDLKDQLETNPWDDI